jgi:hypothetical protein
MKKSGIYYINTVTVQATYADEIMNIINKSINPALKKVGYVCEHNQKDIIISKEKKMKITKADIGRRVEVSGLGSIGNRFYKNKGTIIDFIHPSWPPISIKFDEKVGSHTCNGLCAPMYGYNVTEDMITFIDEKEKKMKKSKRCTGIRIETEKVIMVSGDFGYKILSVNALTRNKLPWMYLKGEPCVYLHKPTYSKHYLSLGNQKEIKVGNTYTILKFQELMDYCKKAGDRLMQVNKEIKERKKQWNGKETFVI